MNLTTQYLGLELQHPVIASASPLSRDLDGIRRLEDHGAAAIVLFSIFEEQVLQEDAAHAHLLEAGGESFGEALSYFPQLGSYHLGPDQYLNLIRRSREATAIPIIGSLNATSPEGWSGYATRIEQAGANALELNIYYLPANLEETSAEVEARYLSALHAVKQAVRIPVAVKLGPYFSAFGNMARRLDEAGVDGLVLFNRFYQPDFDLDQLTVAPTLELSRANEIRLGLFWIALLHGRVRASLAATTGVTSGQEVAKYLLAGADAVMTASALLRQGPEHLRSLVDGLSDWMTQKGYASVAQARGTMSHRNVADPTAFERANYIRILENYKSRWG